MTSHPSSASAGAEVEGNDGQGNDEGFVTKLSPDDGALAPIRSDSASTARIGTTDATTYDIPSSDHVCMVGTATDQFLHPSPPPHSVSFPPLPWSNRHTNTSSGVVDFHRGSSSTHKKKTPTEKKFAGWTRRHGRTENGVEGRRSWSKGWKTN